MTTFERRPIRRSNTLGERLRRLREEANLTTEAVSDLCGVAPRYLEAIEEGRYADIPGMVYAKNFVRRYAEALNVRPETALELFDQEYQLATQVTPQPPIAPPPAPKVRESLLTPRNLRRGLFVVLGLAVLVYLGSELVNLTAPPELTVTAPADNLTTSERSVTLTGLTEPETTLTVNGRPIAVARDGRFSDVLDLKDGLNTVIVRAERKRGGTTTIIRRILVQPDETDSTNGGS